MTQPNYMRLFIGILALLAFVPTTTVDAYELATHARLTLEAFNRSVLVDSQFLKDLGIDSAVRDSSGYTLNPFGTIYYDVSGSTVNERQANPNGVAFDARFLGLSTENPDQTFIFPAWLMRGAIREDDVLEPDNGQPVEDPYNTGNALLDNRVLNHFYDPVHNWPLTVGMVLGKKAPDWAIGSEDVFSQPNTSESNRRNHFTVFDAREAMYRALTGKNKDNQDVAPTKDDRNKYWATLFRALGDIMHLVEDMAQPQHTRNDPHAGKKYDGNPGVRGHKSLYEAYIETRAAAKEFELPSGDKFIPPQLNYTGYDTPRFTDYLSYFTTRQVDSDIMARRGLADYSNRGFFSAGKNLNPFDDAQYDYPSNNAPSYGRQPVTTNWLGQPFGGTMTLFIGTVPDSLTGQIDTGVPLTAIGAWDQFLEQKNLFSISRYTLVRDNYDAQAALLIPRAVAYSAGLIDYFFRGRIEVEDAHYTDTGIELKVKNTIDPEKYTEWQNETLYAKTSADAPSTLRIAYEYQDENNVTQYGASDAVDLNTSNGDDDIAPGKISRKVYSFTLTIPSGKIRNLKYRLVFRGRLGDEDDAVVAASFKPVSGFLVAPSYAPQDGISVSGEARMIYRTASGWKLAPDTGLVAGNIDWKGRYEPDPAGPPGALKPTKVLSWVGPKMRYFPDYETCQTTPFGRCKWISSSDFSREIFENGEIIANAPANVLGAAITKDLDGKDWLVAICMIETEDVVYRRPYRKGSDAPYDPVDAPNGWMEIGRFDASTVNQGASRTTHHADIPWFFSGDGKKAQMMRRWWETTSNDIYEKLMRLEINITDDIALVMPPQNHDNLDGFTETRTCSTNYDQYGAGTGQRTYSASGEYIVAVDYDKSGNEILAKVRIAGNSTTTSNVSITNGVLTGNTQVSEDSYKEDLVWKDGNILPIYSDGVSYNASWGSGPQPSNNYYTRIADRTTHVKEISYLVDLRYNLYSYYYANMHDREDIAEGVKNYVENTDEGNEVASDLMSSTISLYSSVWPTYTSSTTSYQAEKEINCDPFIPSPFISRRYGLSNFGWFLRNPGSGMADSAGNYAISYPSVADFGYETLSPANLLSGGRLEDLIKTAPQDAYYYPISVLY